MSDNSTDNGGVYKSLVIIIKSTDGVYRQVALTQEMCDCIFHDLQMYFKGGVVKVVPTPITSIEFDYEEEE